MSNKISKESTPDNFTLPLVFVDAIPVVFFGASMALLGFRFSSPLFVIGALLCFYAGAMKVVWKFIVVRKRKNIWWMFLQLRIVMPIGFLMMVAAAIIGRDAYSMAGIWNAIIAFPAVIFFGIGLLGMVVMMVCAFRLDSSDVKSNWIEQIINSVAQISIFLGILLC